MKKRGFYWHIYHNILFEHCYNYEERVYYIKNHKPKNEIEIRLRLFKPVKAKLLVEIAEARQKYAEASLMKCVEAGQKYNEALRKYDDVLAKHPFFIEELHKKECGCKEWNGNEIKF